MIILVAITFFLWPSTVLRAMERLPQKTEFFSAEEQLLRDGVDLQQVEGFFICKNTEAEKERLVHANHINYKNLSFFIAQNFKAHDMHDDLAAKKTSELLEMSNLIKGGAGLDYSCYCMANIVESDSRNQRLALVFNDYPSRGVEVFCVSGQEVFLKTIALPKAISWVQSLDWLSKSYLIALHTKVGCGAQRFITAVNINGSGNDIEIVVPHDVSQVIRHPFYKEKCFALTKNDKKNHIYEYNFLTKRYTSIVKNLEKIPSLFVLKTFDKDGRYCFLKRSSEIGHQVRIMVPTELRLPLSYMQGRLLFLNKKSSDIKSYKDFISDCLVSYEEESSRQQDE